MTLAQGAILWLALPVTPTIAIYKLLRARRVG